MINYDCLRLVFCYVEIKDLPQYASVNKLWQEVLSNETFWMGLLERMCPKIAKPLEISAKQYLISYACNSPDQVVRCISKLLSKVHWGQQGEFTCRFPQHSEYTLTIRMGCHNVATPIKDSCIFFIGKGEKVRSKRIKDSINADRNGLLREFNYELPDIFKEAVAKIQQMLVSDQVSREQCIMDQ